MSWRSVVISNPARLSIGHKQLLVTQGEMISIPLEDIGAIIIENQQTNLTSKLLSGLADTNIALYICDEKHIPTGVYTPFNNHSRQSKVVKTQLDLTKSFKKRCWRMLVKQKIMNQSKCLEILKKPNYNIIRSICNDVKSGDTTNREAYAAKIYFNILFDNFTRKDDSIINAALNYGYAIIRGAIARSIVGYGFLPSLGLHHCSELNNYNLADDFIEPFRPIVDLWVAENMTATDEFNKYHRMSLVNLLHHECIISNKRQSILNAIDIMIGSFTSACQKNEYGLLLLPGITPLRVHYYE